MSNLSFIILTPKMLGVVFIPILESYSTSFKLAKTPTLNNHWTDAKKQIIIAKLEIVAEVENTPNNPNVNTPVDNIYSIKKYLLLNLLYKETKRNESNKKIKDKGVKTKTKAKIIDTEKENITINIASF